MKSVILSFRADFETLVRIQEVMDKLGVSQSDAIRMSVNVLHSLLSSAPAVEDDRIVIQNPVVNIVKQEAVQMVKSENVLKLKKEIDQLQRELEKTLSENLELKQKLQQFQQLQKAAEQKSSSQCDETLKQLRDLRFLIAVAVECLERDDCDKQKLLEHLRSKAYVSHQERSLAQALIRQWVRK